jgi:hypothetical protein
MPAGFLSVRGIPHFRRPIISRKRSEQIGSACCVRNDGLVVKSQMEQLKIASRMLGQMLMPGFCPRCFWITLHCGGKLPYQTPFPGIFNAIDGYGKDIIHDYFDRKGKLPPWYPNIGKVTSYLSSKKLHWTQFRYEDPKTRIVLRGTPDDIFKTPAGTHHIVDYKTAKATGTQDKLFPLYLVQLNVYAYIANARGEFPTTALTLIYVEPMTEIPSTEFDLVMDDAGFALNFMATAKKVELKDGTFIPELMQRAREIYERSKPPAGREGCKDCEALERLMRVAKG